MVDAEYAASSEYLGAQTSGPPGIRLSSPEVNITPTALTTPVASAVLVSTDATLTTLSNIVCSEAEVTAEFSSDTVAPGVDSTLTITLAPTELGERTFTVQFDTDDVNYPTMTVTVLQHLATNAISASAGANGVIYPEGSVVVAVGATQVFTVTADAGFVLGTLLVDEVSAVLTGGTYTFTNVTASHSIAATFVAV